MSATYRIVDGLPPYGAMAVPFSASGRGTHSQGLVVEFILENGQNWFGNFQPVDPDHHSDVHSGYSAVKDHPDRQHVIVVAIAQGYVIDPHSKQCVETLGSDIREIWCPSELGIDETILIFWDGDHLMAVGPKGPLWTTRISHEYYYKGSNSSIGPGTIQIQGRQLKGKLLTHDGSWGYIPFSVDLMTGKAEFVKMNPG